MKLRYLAALVLASILYSPAMAQVEELVPAAELVTGTPRAKVFWLILTGYKFNATIPTATIEQCEVSGAEFVASKRFNIDYRKFECLEGIR